METTGSTGTYGGLVETLETATLLAEKGTRSRRWRFIATTRLVPQQITPRALPTQRKLLPISYHPITTIVGQYFSRSVHACRSIDRQNHPDFT